jgi:hypothetical protein
MTGAFCSARVVGFVATGFGGMTGLIGATDDGVVTLLLEPAALLATLEFGLARPV